MRSLDYVMRGDDEQWGAVAVVGAVLYAPVVQAHSNIKQKAVAAGEVKIEETAQNGLTRVALRAKCAA